VISWEYLRSTPDYEFVDWNFSNTTAEDYAWCVSAIHASGHDIYIADFTHLDVYACRIFVPGMSEIYPVEDLEWENNTVGNWVRPGLLKLNSITKEECTEMLAAFHELELADEWLVATLIGLCADANTHWPDLRVGELKTLLALAVGDKDEILEGCTWIKQFGQLSEQRASVYRCIENIVQLQEMIESNDIANYQANCQLMFGAGTFKLAMQLLNHEVRFFGLGDLGNNMQGSQMHQQLLAAYDKVRAAYK